ncbi:hypothetical protein WN943_003104 [Citrus x changshan-huyou]
MKHTTILVILFLTLHNGWSLQQLEINNTFLSGTLDEEVIKKKPPGFVDTHRRNFVCRLKKSIYVDDRIQQSCSNASLFIFHHNGVCLIFLTYVDDTILTGNNNLALAKFIHALGNTFALKDLALSFSTPLKINDGLNFVDATLFRQLIGALQYVTLTCPYICFVDTIFVGLFFCSHSNTLLTAYTDSDWDDNLDDRSSTSGYVIFFCGNPVSRSSKTQRSIARSSTEAKFRSIASTFSEICWLYNLLFELAVKIPKPVLYCDNLGATFVCTNLVYH